MSSFMKATKHPETGSIEDAWWIDDMYGPHRYGVVFKDGSAYKADDREWVTEDRRIDPNITWEDAPKELRHL